MTRQDDVMNTENKEKEESESEIIGQRRVYTSRPKRVKIKIKERVSRKVRRKYTLIIKLVAVFLAAMLGFLAGGKAVTRYLSFWKTPRAKYIPTEEQHFTLRKGH